MILNILKAHAAIKDLETKVSEYVAQIESLTKQVDELKEREAAFSLGSQDWAKEKEEMAQVHEEAMLQLKAEYEQKLLEKETTVKEAQESVEVKAAEIAASVGLEPETVKLTSDELVSKNVAKSRYTITFKNNK